MSASHRNGGALPSSCSEFKKPPRRAVHTAQTRKVKKSVFVSPLQCTTGKNEDAVRCPCMMTEYEYLHPTEHKSLRLRVMRSTTVQPRTNRRTGQRQAKRRDNPPVWRPDFMTSSRVIGGAELSSDGFELAAATASGASGIMTTAEQYTDDKCSERRKRSTSSSRKIRRKLEFVYSCPLCCASCTFCPLADWKLTHEHYTTHHWDNRRTIGKFTIFPCGNCCTMMRDYFAAQKLPTDNNNNAAAAAGITLPDSLATTATHVTGPLATTGHNSNKSLPKRRRVLTLPLASNSDTCCLGHLVRGEEKETLANGALESLNANGTGAQCIDTADAGTNVTAEDASTGTKSVEDAGTGTKSVEDASTGTKSVEDAGTGTECDIDNGGGTVRKSSAGLPVESMESVENIFHFHCPIEGCSFISLRFKELEMHCTDSHANSDADPTLCGAEEYKPFVPRDFYFFQACFAGDSQSAESTSGEECSVSDALSRRDVLFTDDEDEDDEEEEEEGESLESLGRLDDSDALTDMDIDCSDAEYAGPSNTACAKHEESSVTSKIPAYQSLSPIEDHMETPRGDGIARDFGSDREVLTPTRPAQLLSRRPQLRRQNLLRGDGLTKARGINGPPRSVAFSPVVQVRTFDARLSRIEKLSSILEEAPVVSSVSDDMVMQTTPMT